MILHDTNMKRIYRRADRSLGLGWDNDRGVIRALEETLGAKFNEEQDFVTVRGRLAHQALGALQWPNSAGKTLAIVDSQTLCHHANLASASLS